MILFITITLLSAYLTLFLHESSHVLICLFSKTPIKRFVLWPTIKNGKFYWGRVETKTALPEHWKPLFYLMPFAKACFMTMLWIMLLICNNWLIYLIPFVIWEIIDLTKWLTGFFRKRQDSDGLKFRNLIFEAN